MRPEGARGVWLETKLGHGRIVACDMTKTPLEDGSLDVVLFSLSLMGANFTEYLREAWRVLKLDGQLHLFEATSRFGYREEFVAGLKKLGFANVEMRDAWQFMHIYVLKMDHVTCGAVGLTLCVCLRS